MAATIEVIIIINVNIIVFDKFFSVIKPKIDPYYANFAMIA